MQIPLNFITNCCKLKRVLSLLALLFCLLPVEKFDFLPENRRPLKLFAVTNKKKKMEKGKEKSNEREENSCVCGKHFWVACGWFSAANFDCLASFVAFFGGSHNYLLNY